MSAWYWLKAELARRLGEEVAAELWREYWARAALDREAARLKTLQRRAGQGSARARRTLAERGDTPEDATP